MTHDYKRYGVTTLFAALKTLDGSVISTCMERHRHTEWLKFLRLIDKRVDETLDHRRQLCHAQACQSAAMAQAPSALPRALYAHELILAQHG
jgi:hypothetical protein